MAYSVVFPGQGSQRLHMGRDFIEAFPLAGDTIEEAAAGSELDLLALIDDDQRLHLTEFTQPALLAVEVAMFRVLHQIFGCEADAFAGHSLGEYSALVAAGVMPLSTAARLVRLRGRLMQSCVAAGAGAMVAVIGRSLDLGVLQQLAATCDVQLANYNSPTQVVVSGLCAGIDAFSEATKREGGRALVVPLQVSAPFHCELMAPAAAAFGDAMEPVLETLSTDALPRVLSNVSGTYHQASGQALLTALSAQIAHPVRWTDTMTALIARGTPIVEIGPKSVLKRFFKDVGSSIQSVTTLDEAQALFGGGGE